MPDLDLLSFCHYYIMAEKRTYINQSPLQGKNEKVEGVITDVDGESFYCIRNYDLMPPFLMSIVSNCDLWMYISSGGGLTAGRRNYQNVLFPYETDDKIHESSGNTGPKTLILLKEAGKTILWEPFSDRHAGLYAIRRNLYKNTPGNQILFEEVNDSLGLVFRYSWSASDSLGWVRKSTLENLTATQVEAEICDGLLNVMPWGIERETQSMMSTLMDAYKVGEYLPEHHLALYYLSSIPVDRAEPSEALRSNTVWTCGTLNPEVLLTSGQMDQIRQGGQPERPSNMVFGQKTAFLVHDHISLEASSAQSWYIVADLAKDSSDVLQLQRLIKKSPDLSDLIESSLRESTDELNRKVALADGVQHTGDALNDRRHFANVLFNIMRGGLFEQEYTISTDDYLRHLACSNKNVYQKHAGSFRNNNQSLSWHEALQDAKDSGDDDLYRLTLEYLPLSFSRRHGDPSRPWNFFDIRVKNADGTPSLNYQGNWRDIFQNWEALAMSFPAFLPGMIARFLNASTADGYNPYRITREGFDWEVPEPDNPWAGIGYWGDHQVIYLLKLLEMQEKFFPAQTWDQFNGKHFVFARVPYRIKGYQEILKDPQDTIVFDQAGHEKLLRQSEAMGADGKLMLQTNQQPWKATFTEKILVLLLTKLSNFVPEAGIWLNTQRPEWNDANNALVGHGASMVTLYHLRRFVAFLRKITKQHPDEAFTLQKEIMEFKQHVADVLIRYRHLLDQGFTDNERREVTDQLGIIGEAYRTSVYAGFLGERKNLSKSSLLAFYGFVLQYLDQSIAANRKGNGLYHSYNLLHFKENAIKIDHLYLMLEGQAAILHSGMLSPKENLTLMQSLFASDLWRADQQSFMLYPFRELPGFLQKNIIRKELAESSWLLRKMLQQGDTRIIKQDEAGLYHFEPSLRNARLLSEVLWQIQEEDPGVTNADIDRILEIYEDTFNHRAFTGRSGSFYKYEGLGSIYWHMVSKLLLALGENIMEFAQHEQHQDDILPLKDYYYRIRKGIGAHKAPQEYGAFPTDPYSHTPSMMGVQQPGMTGQVKEDILSRYHELGIRIEAGQIVFFPALLRDSDFSKNGVLSFSFCNVPIFYQKGSQKGLHIHWMDTGRETLILPGKIVPADISASIFDRSGEIREIFLYF